MDIIHVGDVVTRKSYNEDILFYVLDLYYEKGEAHANLVGVNVRLRADSPVIDLIIQDYRGSPSSTSELKTVANQIVIQQKKLLSEITMRNLTDQPFMVMPGKVLHIDGEEHYLAQCMALYNNLNVPVIGLHVPEVDQPHEIRKLLETYRPDILVITGHDGLLRKQSSQDRLINYRASPYFVETVKDARLYEPDRDSLVIIAGACQSHFEALIEAGANFASSPQRVMIHCYDPVLIAEKIAFTSFTQVIDIRSFFHSTISGSDGIGGLETKGKQRYGYPKLKN